SGHPLELHPRDLRQRQMCLRDTYKTLVWTSSDETVAIVDSEGNVTAVNVGEAEIVATASDGSEISALCHVSVMPILVESIVLTPDSWSAEVGDSFLIQASVYPENATDKTLDWISSDEEIAKVDSDGLITLYKEGSCTITVLSTDGSNISAECYITGTADLESLLKDDNVEIDIYDMNGILIRKNCSKDVLKQLTPDIYLVRIGHQVKCIVIR
ncbi:MAG: Ig-like domain-containing protein, partial [Muribaculaceae bacterium]|nr:Ig-like domain-containing protein [Muribaculaceae bacterium]